VHVDETRREDQRPCIDSVLRFETRAVANPRDPLSDEGDIGGKALSPTTIHNARLLENHFEQF
jgi:hypothetical protein